MDLHGSMVAGKHHDRQLVFRRVLQHLLDGQQVGLLAQILTHVGQRRDAAQLQLLQHGPELVRIGHGQPAVAQVQAGGLVQRGTMVGHRWFERLEYRRITHRQQGCRLLRRDASGLGGSPHRNGRRQRRSRPGGHRGASSLHRRRIGCLCTPASRRRQRKFIHQFLPGGQIGVVRLEDFLDGHALPVEELQADATVVVHLPCTGPFAEEKPQVDVGAQHQTHLRVDFHHLELAVALVHGPFIAGQAQDAPQTAQLRIDLHRLAGDGPGRHAQLARHQFALGHAQLSGTVANAHARRFGHQRVMPRGKVLECVHVDPCNAEGSGKPTLHSPCPARRHPCTGQPACPDTCERTRAMVYRSARPGRRMVQRAPDAQAVTYRSIRAQGLPGHPALTSRRPAARRTRTSRSAARWRWRYRRSRSSSGGSGQSWPRHHP